MASQLGFDLAEHDGVREIHYDLAAPFIRQWHYSHDVPKGSHTFFGWYVAGALYAVADYGNNVNPYQTRYLRRALELPELEGFEWLELKRLCRTEPRIARAPLTQFLARCHRVLRARGIRVVLSFSDPAQGHNGGIYRAANFTHSGTTQAEWHVKDSTGLVLHRRRAYRHARATGCTIAEARDRLGLTRVQTIPKDRWVLRLR